MKYTSKILVILNFVLFYSNIVYSKVEQKNILGSKLETCSIKPLTGFLRTGHCYVSAEDYGNHSVCAKVTKEFLDYTKSQGNDLVTPNKHYNFPGLKPGDRWCLCAQRWKQAKDNGIRLHAIKKATNKKALNVISLEELN